MPKVDLHIHSRFSDRSAEWIARRLSLPDSYSEPRFLYGELRKRGMQFVTLTDHNRIEGCLEIAELPGTFISEQVTTYFPEDRCQAHLLVWGISEQQHREIQSCRENIYDLQKYLAQEQLAHAVAHPLFRSNDRLEPSHFEKLILLFKCFEGINGLRDALLGDVARFILGALTPERIEQMANRHNLAPTHEKPWHKTLVAGSDDHGGIFPASAYTEVREAVSPGDFLAKVKAGRCSPKGKGGTPLALSHGLYNTISKFISDRLPMADKQSAGLIEKVFSRFMEGKDPTEFSFSEKLGFLAQGLVSGKIFELAKPANASFWKQLSNYVSDTDLKALLAKETAGVKEPERRAFIIANLFANQLAFRFFTKFVKQLSSGNIIESLQDFSTLAPILLILSPYIYSFQSQSPSRKWLREISRQVAGEIPPVLQNRKRAWFTDTLEDVNGVANTIRKLTAAGVASGKEITVVTSRNDSSITDIPIKNFQPIGEFELPEYELQKLSFPPVLRILDYIQSEGFTEVIVSTPGPIGLTAILAAKMLSLPVSGIYHTDFPQYVRILTDDSFLETLTWNFMRWFYSQCDLIYVNSEHYRHCWVSRGIPSEKIRILPRGLDSVLFNPSRRNPTVRARFGATNGEAILLYVGRVSKEKDLDVLATAYRKLQNKNAALRLVIVGHGPYLNELKATLPEAHFTGYLAGEDLATVFASSDIFVFPSTTDTFGNVVLEALASGLPCVVSDSGGPRELVEDAVTGFVTESLSAESFARGVEKIAADPALRAEMSRKARQSIAERDWGAAFEKFWANSLGL